MTEYIEKINFLYCSNEGSPVSSFYFDEFPLPYSFTLQSLVFNLRIENEYTITTLVYNNRDEAVVRTSNPFSLDTDLLNSDKFTNVERTQASSLIAIKTPNFTIVGPGTYRIKMILSDSTENELSSQETYASVQGPISDKI